MYVVQAKKKDCFMETIQKKALNRMRGSRGGTGGQDPPPLKNHKAMGF